MNENMVKTDRGTMIEDPPFARLLFSDTRSAGVWLVVRVLLGLAWLQAGWGKVTDPGWMQTGESLLSYWTRAASVPEQGRPPIAYDWYRGFIQGMIDADAYTWFAPLVAIGEVLIGLALIAGAFVGIAAFLGAFLNWNFVMAGTASTNALLAIAAILLILAWKVAGYYGLDRYLLPRLGTPWTPRRARAAAPAEVNATRNTA